MFSCLHVCLHIFILHKGFSQTLFKFNPLFTRFIKEWNEIIIKEWSETYLIKENEWKRKKCKLNKTIIFEYFKIKDWKVSNPI